MRLVSELNFKWPASVQLQVRGMQPLIGYCKVSLLIYSGCSSLSNGGRFFTHPV